jgi:hypothetical protein
MSIDYTKPTQMSILMLCFLTLAGFFTHNILFLRIIMNENGYRIFRMWMLDLNFQQLTDEEKAHRVDIAIRLITTFLRKGHFE